MTCDVSALRRRYELRGGFGSMSSEELLEATRQALLTIYTPQQTAIWLNVHVPGDPIAVAHKALRLCVLDLTVEVADDMVDRDELRGSGVGPSDTFGPVEPFAALVSGAASERVVLEVQRVTTAAVRALLTCPGSEKGPRRAARGGGTVGRPHPATRCCHDHDQGHRHRSVAGGVSTAVGCS